MLQRIAISSAAVASSAISGAALILVAQYPLLKLVSGGPGMDFIYKILNKDKYSLLQNTLVHHVTLARQATE